MSLSVLILAALLCSVHSTEGTVEKLTLRYDKRTVGYLYLTEDHDNVAMSNSSILFRAGSGATGSGPVANAADANVPKPTFRKPTEGRKAMKMFTLMSPLLCLLYLIFMMPHHGAGHGGPSRDFNYRVPPSWSPENESNYSFRAWLTDITILDHADRFATASTGSSNRESTRRIGQGARTHDVAA